MTDQNFNQSLPNFLDSLVPDRSVEMQQMETYAQEHGFPIIGPASGYFCYALAKMIKAKKVFELGSGYGYSTAWFAKAVQENGGGIVHHVVWDENLSQMAKTHLGNLGYSEIINYTMGEAVETLENTDDTFDLIFNDIDKQAYPDSLAVIENKIRPGGILVVDNMLWSGKMLDESHQDPNTKSIRKFINLITTSNKWVANLIPIRDGLMVAYRV
ncbi:MAG: O-methyltransferase [Chloroflexota bacterium]